MTPTATVAPTPLELLALGFRVLPCWHLTRFHTCMCERGTACGTPGKHPCVGWKEYQTCAPTPDQVTAWTREFPQANWGGVLGADAGCVVFDFDGAGAERLLLDRGIELPLSPTIRSGRGNKTLFRHPGGDWKRAIGFLQGPEGCQVDFLGEGSIVMLPPSRHYMGGVYAWVEPPTTPLAVAPPALLELVRQAPRSNGAGRALDTGDGPPDYAALLQGVPHGRRHVVSCQLAGHWAHLGVPLPEAAALGERWCDACEAVDPRPINRAKVSATLRDIYEAEARQRRNGAGPTMAVEDPAPPREEPIRPAAPYRIVTPPESFITQYVRAAQARTDAPPESQELTAVAVLSALAGPWPRIPLAHRTHGVRLVLWTMNVVDSTSGRKTTVNEWGVNLLLSVLGEEALLPWKASPEAFFQRLATRDSQPSILARDEFTGLLAAMKRGGYMAGLAQDLIRAYDGYPITMARTAKMSRATGLRVDDTDRIRDPYLVQICAATRTEFTEVATREDFLDGLLTRFIFTSGQADPRAPVVKTPAMEQTWLELVGRAQAFHHRARTVGQIGITPAVLEAAWTLEERYQAIATTATRPEIAGPSMRRLAESVLKVAALLAIDRTTTGPPIITPEDFEAAAALGERWQGTTLGIIADVGRTRFRARSDAVLSTLQAHPTGMPLQGVYRAHRDLAKRELEEILGTLEAGDLVHRVVQQGGQRGRPPVMVFPGPPR